MTDWSPANEVEKALLAALESGDTEQFLRLLVDAELLVPVTTVEHDGRRYDAWATATLDEKEYAPVFTSLEALRLAGGGEIEGRRYASFRQIAAAWPDMHYPMLLDPMTPLHSRIAVSDVLRLSAWPVIDVLDHPGGSAGDLAGTLMHKFMPVAQAQHMLRENTNLVSGYAVAGHDITHLGTFDELLSGLDLPMLAPGITAESDGFCVLRWLAVGASLYRVPIGGVDAERMTVADGWVIDHPSYRGTGFVDGADPPVQLFKLRPLRIRHGAELVQVDRAGEDLVAVWNADESTWQLSAEFVSRIQKEGDP